MQCTNKSLDCFHSVPGTWLSRPDGNKKDAFTPAFLVRGRGIARGKKMPSRLNQILKGIPCISGPMTCLCKMVIPATNKDEK